MANKFVSIDSGKYATKSAMWNETKWQELLKENAKKKKEERVDEKDLSLPPELFSFRTMYEESSFIEDQLPAGTFLARIDGKVYKIGNGASTQSELNLSKQSEIHRICTLAVLANFANENEVDTFHVAIGTPIAEYRVPDKRQEYKYFILTKDKGESMKSALEESRKNGTPITEPSEEEFEVEIKKDNNSPVVKKKFKIVTRHVYPESAGAIYLDLTKYKDEELGVIDLGSSTGQGVEYENFDVRPNSKYFCSENGGSMMIAGLAQKLTSECNSRVNENTVKSLLRMNTNERFLIPKNGTDEEKNAIKEKSAKVIKEYLLNYVRDIKKCTDANQWSTEFMQLIFIGGTAHVLRDELYEVFGKSIEISNNPKNVNALGFLRRLVAQELSLLIKI